jgi:hypothetical protein
MVGMGVQWGSFVKRAQTHTAFFHTRRSNSLINSLVAMSLHILLFFSIFAIHLEAENSILSRLKGCRVPSRVYGGGEERCRQ